MYLVIDTWVWEKAQQGEAESIELLAKIQRKCKHKIIYDCEEEILKEYRKHIKQPPIAKLFSIMTQAEKIVPKSKGPIKIEGFDKSDLKFIQVAVSCSALVVSGDSDFLELRERFLKNGNRKIQILTPAEALDRL
jgi:putative PIN family toxin of toxin-antitoxin system